jgi:hypothetical protein
VLPAANSEAAASVLWFAAIEGIKRNQDLADLSPPKQAPEAKPTAIT